MSVEREVESPCIKVCTLDAATQLCTGCFRSLDEIARWIELSNAERAAIVAALPERGKRFAARAPQAQPNTKALRCARCGAEFSCGANDREHPCWCATYPVIDASATGVVGCVCPACLAALSSR